MRRRDQDSSLRDCLYTVERVLADERIKVSPSRQAELWNLDEAGVQAIRELRPDYSRR